MKRPKNLRLHAGKERFLQSRNVSFVKSPFNSLSLDKFDEKIYWEKYLEKSIGPNVINSPPRNQQSV